MLTVNALKRLHIGPVDFTIDAGECVALTGSSGAGKSVLLRAIADLDPNTGTLTCDGARRTDIPAPTWRRTVAYLPAESGWWADRVADHFSTPEKMRARLPDVGMTPDAMDWDVARLSTGERHRIALLRTLEMAPIALLLDEPTAALDPQTTQHIETLLKRLLSDGMAILLVTHDAAQSKRMATRTLRLENGQLIP